MPRLSVSGLSILMALALALWEWLLFFHREDLGGFGLLSSNRLGLNLAWVTLIYLSFQLLSIPFAVGASRDRFIGVLDGMASLVPLGVALVAIFGKPEDLGTPERWEVAFLLLCVSATDLFGGYAINIALSRRMMDVAPTTV
jgi:hypothetical protein